MKPVKMVAGLLGLMACSSLAAAPAPLDPKLVLPLWPGVAPGFENARQVEKETPMPGGKALATRNITQPTLSVYLPSPERATGTGVIVAPGGGFRFLTMGAEGHDVARWLADRGIAAFVLKYRVVETPEDDAAMWDKVKELMQALIRSDEQLARLDEDGRAGIADGIRAMEIVRERAAAWGVAPDRIGFMGFSAGAVVTSHVALKAPDSARPNFAAPIYGAPFGKLPPLSSSTPPIFLAYSSDDPLVGPAVDAFHVALRKAGHHPELHIYRNGGHGYGLNKQGLSSDFWIEDFYNWLRSLGLTQRAAVGSP